MGDFGGIAHYCRERRPHYQLYSIRRRFLSGCSAYAHHADADADAESDGESITNAFAHPDGIAFADAESFCFSHSLPVTLADGISFSFAITQPDGDALPHPESDRVADPVAKSDGNGLADSFAQPHIQPDPTGSLPGGEF